MNFERSEYAARLAATRRATADQGIELLVVADPSNMAWLTGYDGWSFYVHQCVLVGGAGDESVLAPDMCFHLIPAIWKEDWGLEITERFLVTERGAEPFCDFPRRLFVKP